MDKVYYIINRKSNLIWNPTDKCFDINPNMMDVYWDEKDIYLEKELDDLISKGYDVEVIEKELVF